MFNNLVTYVRNNMNLVDFEVHGRYVIERYDDGQGNTVTIDVFDRQPQVVHRSQGPVYRDKAGAP